MKVTEKIEIMKPEEIEVEFDLGEILNNWDLSKNRMDRAREALERITDYPGVVWRLLERNNLIETEKQEVGHGSKEHFVFITGKGKDEMAKNRLGIS